MSEPFVIAPGGGEVIGDSPERRVEILCDRDPLHATFSRFGPGREGADLHVHREHTDLFYVLSGELTLRLGVEDEPVAAAAGTLARVPPLVVHGFRNASGADVTYLNLHAPGEGFADFMRALRDGRPAAYDQHPPPDDGGRPTGEAAIGAEPVIVEGPGVRMAVLAEVDAIAIADVRCDPGAVAPGSAGDGLRSLYVLAGEVVVTAGGQELRAGQGSWVTLPGSAASSITAAGPKPARFLDLRTPGAGFSD
jgi:quercetin dioxygenase-like cupin family protein